MDEFTPQGLFRLLQGPALAQLSRDQVGRGTTLVQQGTAADAMYLVETGRFRVERDGVELAEIGAGGVIGEIAFLTGQPRTADVIAARDAMVYKITRSEFETLCLAEPGLAQAIAAELAQRLADTSARVPPDPQRPPARTFAIIPAASAPLPERFVRDLAELIGTHHRVAVVTEADFTAALAAGADPASPEGVAWLNAQELAADIVLFVATPDPTPWSQAALRQADQAVFVAQAIRFADPSPLEQIALEMLPEAQRRLVLIHPHRMQSAPGTSAWLDSRPSFLHHHVALTDDQEDIARLARFLAGRAIGMVLSGGGAFGVSHVGVSP